MKYSLNITQTEANAMAGELLDRMKEVQGKVEFKMAETFQDCVLQNFGATGPYRPWSGWAPLSPRYARTVGRDYATLEVSGRLKQNVLIELRGDNFEVTSSDDRVPYATVHQFGGGNNIPAREYFPLLESGDVTRQVEDIVVEAAREELRRLLEN